MFETTLHYGYRQKLYKRTTNWFFEIDYIRARNKLTWSKNGMIVTVRWVCKDTFLFFYFKTTTTRLTKQSIKFLLSAAYSSNVFSYSTIRILNGDYYYTAKKELLIVHSDVAWNEHKSTTEINLINPYWEIPCQTRGYRVLLIRCPREKRWFN